MPTVGYPKQAIQTYIHLLQVIYPNHLSEILIEKENIRHTSKQCIHQMISSQKRARVHDESLAAKYMSTMKLASPRDFLQLQTYTHYPIPRSLNILLWRRERQCAHKEQSLS